MFFIQIQTCGKPLTLNLPTKQPLGLRPNDWQTNFITLFCKNWNFARKVMYGGRWLVEQAKKDICYDWAYRIFVYVYVCLAFWISRPHDFDNKSRNLKSKLVLQMQSDSCVRYIWFILRFKLVSVLLVIFAD